MRIIVDCQGGDLGIRAPIEGAAAAVESLGIEVLLVANEREVEKTLASSGISRRGLTILHAEDSITMEDDPVDAVRQKPGSSMMTALRALKEGQGDALVSSGNTGALLTGATLTIRRIPGIRRGALGILLPNETGYSLLMDCGANTECTPDMLLQFGQMGAAFVSGTLKIPSPRVGLISNGMEATKGTPLVQEAHTLLREASDAGLLRFVGNVEGRDIATGTADVFVTDGFTGNIILKTYEGVGMFFSRQIKGMFLKNTVTKLASLPLRSGLLQMKKKMDYTEVGGAPILGIRRPVIKAHGSSNARAFQSAIAQAYTFVQSNAISDIEIALSKQKSANKGGVDDDS